MEKQIQEKVIVAVISALILGFLVLIWNWLSKGGAVHMLGGITHIEAQELVDKQVAKVVEKIRNDLRVGTEIIPAPGGNGKSKTCPPGSVMIGALWQSDLGGPHGILSWVSPICRTMGK